MAKFKIPAAISRPLGLNYEATFGSSSYSMEDAIIAKIDADKDADKAYEADLKKAFSNYEDAAKAVIGRRIVVR